MSDVNFALIKSSFPMIFQKKAQIAAHFYKALFQAAPETRAMFGDDMASQKEMFATMLATLARTSLDQASLHTVVVRMTDSHRALGISPKQFRAAEAALNHALQECLGDTMSPEAFRAWRQALSRLIDGMIRAPVA